MGCMPQMRAQTLVVPCLLTVPGIDQHCLQSLTCSVCSRRLEDKRGLLSNTLAGHWYIVICTLHNSISRRAIVL